MTAKLRSETSVTKPEAFNLCDLTKAVWRKVLNAEVKGYFCALFNRGAIVIT